MLSDSAKLHSLQNYGSRRKGAPLSNFSKAQHELTELMESEERERVEIMRTHLSSHISHAILCAHAFQFQLPLQCGQPSFTQACCNADHINVNRNHRISCYQIL